MEDKASQRFLHLAMDIKGIEQWSDKNRISLGESYHLAFFRLKQIIELQTEQKIPLFSFLILPLYQTERKELLDEFCRLIDSQPFQDYLAANKIKVTLLGKWYDLPLEVVSSLKKLIESTKNYDHYFLNFCLNYDGQEELIDAFKNIVRQVLAGKLFLENINRETVKENLYSSYFVPPSLFIKNGSFLADSFLLWDSVGAKYVFTGKDFLDLTKEDVINITTGKSIL